MYRFGGGLQGFAKLFGRRLNGILVDRNGVYDTANGINDSFGR